MQNPKVALHHLDDRAKALGYTDYQSMLHDLYVVQGLGVTPLAHRLHLSRLRVIKHLNRFKIPRKTAGGANNVKVLLTPALLHEVEKNGVPATAARLGIEPHALYAKLKGLKP